MQKPTAKASWRAEDSAVETMGSAVAAAGLADLPPGVGWPATLAGFPVVGSWGPGVDLLVAFGLPAAVCLPALGLPAPFCLLAPAGDEDAGDAGCDADDDGPQRPVSAQTTRPSSRRAHRVPVRAAISWAAVVSRRFGVPSLAQRHTRPSSLKAPSTVRPAKWARAGYPAQDARDVVAPGPMG